MTLTIVVLGILALIIGSISKEKWDYVSISVIGALVVTLLLVFASPHPFNPLETIEFQPLVFIFGMQLAVLVAEKEHVFEYVTIKVIRATKGNQRVFFYLICTLGTVMAAFIADVTVSILFVPLIIKTCRILDVPAGTYSLGLTICINIGSILTPFSSGENIIISAFFGLSMGFYTSYLLAFSFAVLVVTLLLIDRLYINREPKVHGERKVLLLDLLDASVVVRSKRRFYTASLGLVGMFTCLFIFQDVPPLVFALLFGVFLLLASRNNMQDIVREIEWDVIFFFASLFIVIGALQSLGFIALLGAGIQLMVGNSVILASLLVLIFSSVMSAFLANSPTVLIFLPILDYLITGFGFPMTPLAVALLLGVNLGGNFLPQGAACDMMTLNLNKKYNVPNFSYKRLLKVGGGFAFLHLGICCAYVVMFSIPFAIT
ncbi:MAG: anion permease [Candidatus Lokiarchaeota archaeon]|nr:anion permease [Candidatus Lokiarchaeota archaeon]